MEIENVELILRQEVLNVLSESLSIFLFLPVVHALDERAFWLHCHQNRLSFYLILRPTEKLTTCSTEHH